MKIANPPMVGIGTLLTRLAVGLSMAPTLNEILRTNGVKIAEMIIVANKLTIISNRIICPLFVRNKHIIPKLMSLIQSSSLKMQRI